MIILAAIFSIVILLILYLLFMPLSFNLYYAVNERSLKQSSIKLFPFEYHFKKEKPKIKAEKEKKPKRPKTKKQGKMKINFADLIRTEYRTIKAVLTDVAKLIAGIIGSPKFKDFSVALTGGFSSPDLTGYLYGGMMAVKPVLPDKALIAYYPDFQSEKLGGYIKVTAAVRLYEIVKQLLLFIWRLPKLHLIKLYFRLRKGG